MDLPGPLAPGGSVDLGYQAVLAPSAQLTGAALVNTARIRSYESLVAGGRVYSGPQTTARVTPQFPRITTTKTAVDPAPAYIGDPFRWRVTVTNSGGATAYGIDVRDTLPAELGVRRRLGAGGRLRRRGAVDRADRRGPRAVLG